MNAKSDLLIEELVAACIAFGRQVEPNWQTRIEDARVKLCEYIDEVEGLEEDSGSYDSLIPDWANEPKQHWIPVGERLPELYEKVIVFDEGGYMKVDFLCHMRGDFMYSDMKVTHWMPLPTPPEVTE